MKTAAASRLGVVIVHFGDPAPTLSCLRALAAQQDLAAPVVVVDNSATLPAELPLATAHRLVCPDNPGFGVGANRGVARLAGEELAGWVVLNGDVEVLPGFLAAAAQALAAGAGAASGPLFAGGEHGPLWYAGGRIRQLTGTVTQSRSHRDARRRRRVNFLPGAALVISAAAWRATGGFDPAFFLYHEDVDLSRRLTAAGFELWFEPAMRAVHHVGGATGSGDRSPLYLEHLTRTRLLPYPSRLHRLWLAVLHSGWVGLRASAYLLRGSADHAFALLRGHRAALAAVWRGKAARARRRAVAEG